MNYLKLGIWPKNIVPQTINTMITASMYAKLLKCVLTGLNKLHTQLQDHFACTKLCTCKSIKTPLSSTPMLFKVVSCFCVWKQNYSAQQDLTFIISFSWEDVKYSHV